MPCTAAAAPEQGAVFPDDGRQGFVPAGGVGERGIAVDTVPSGRAVEGAQGAASLPRVHAGACLPGCARAAGQHVQSASTDPARTRGPNLLPSRRRDEEVGSPTIFTTTHAFSVAQASQTARNGCPRPTGANTAPAQLRRDFSLPTTADVLDRHAGYVPGKTLVSGDGCTGFPGKQICEWWSAVCFLVGVADVCRNAASGWYLPPVVLGPGADIRG